MEYTTKPLYRECQQKTTKRTHKLPVNEVKAADIKNLGNGIYDVKSQSTVGVTYQVDVTVCTCTCPVGISGAKCKHQLGIHLHTTETLITFPTLSLDLMNLFYQIACGNKPPEGHYASVRNENLSNYNSDSIVQSSEEVISSSQNPVPEEPNAYHPNVPAQVENEPAHVENEPVDVETDHFEVENEPAESESADVENITIDCGDDSVDVVNEPVDNGNEPFHVEIDPVEVEYVDIEDDFDLGAELIERAKKLSLKLKKFKNDPVVRGTCHGIFDLMEKKAVSRNSLAALYYNLRGAKLIKCKYTSLRIHPNSTSIARRKDGTSKGKARGRKGRPFKNGKGPQTPHALEKAVTDNRAPAKKH